MAIIIFNRMSLTRHPYHAWLADTGEPLHLLTHAGKLERFGETLPTADYASAQAFDNYDESGAIEYAALKIAAREPVTHIVAQGENDLERAARLRRQLGLPGQSEASALAFRDKATMRAEARRGGVEVPDWAVVDSTKTLVDFIETHGYPVVLKPRRGSASIGIAVLRSEDDLLAALTAGTTDPLRGEPFFMVERFVPGTLYHVDGVVLDGRPAIVWPSVYAKGSASLDYQEDGGESIASYTLAPSNPLVPRLQQFVLDTHDALPSPRETAFHAEVFVTPDDRLVLCEIASRTAGARIVDGIATAYDINLSEAWARAYCGLPQCDDRLTGGRLLPPLRMSGWGHIAPTPGVVKRAPSQCPLPGYRDFDIRAKVGDRLDRPSSVIDVIASFVFAADDEDHAERMVVDARRWFRDHTEIAPL